MTIRETHSVRATLILRLDELPGGQVILPDDTVKISSADGYQCPLPKRDGYYVFTGTRPECLRIVSRSYVPILLSLADIPDTLLRIAPVPVAGIAAQRCFPFSPETGECVHLGFHYPKAGYAPASELAAGAGEVALFKEDYQDLSYLYHALIPPEGEPLAVLVGEGKGGGRYALSGALSQSYPKRLTRLLPLYRIVGNGKLLAIPLPEQCETVFVLRSGSLKRFDTDGREIT